MSHQLRQATNEMLKYGTAGSAYFLWYAWLLDRNPSVDQSEESDSMGTTTTIALLNKSEMK